MSLLFQDEIQEIGDAIGLEGKFLVDWGTDNIIAAFHKPCKWTPWVPDDLNSWDTGCGEAHCFIEGDIIYNSHSFCPYCGGEIIEDPRDPAEE